jgi:hypothetical protein
MRHRVVNAHQNDATTIAEGKHRTPTRLSGHVERREMEIGAIGSDSSDLEACELTRPRME